MVFKSVQVTTDYIVIHLFSHYHLAGDAVLKLCCIIHLPFELLLA